MAKELRFAVAAGKYDGDERNTKYCEDFGSLQEAVEACHTVMDLHWYEIIDREFDRDVTYLAQEAHPMDAITAYLDPLTPMHKDTTMTQIHRETIQNGNIERIEALLTRCDEASVKEIMARSIAWSFIMGYINARAQLDRLFDEEDVEFRNMPHSLKVQRREALEAQMSEAEDVVAWAMEQTTPDDEWNPDAERVVALVLTGEAPEFVSSEDHVAYLAKVSGTTVEHIQKIERAQHARRAERAEANARVLEANRESVLKDIQRVLTGQAAIDFQISEMAGLRIAEKIANKAEQLSDRRRERAMISRRRRIVERLGCEARMLDELADHADTVAERFGEEIDAAASTEEPARRA